MERHQNERCDYCWGGWGLRGRDWEQSNIDSRITSWLNFPVTYVVSANGMTSATICPACPDTKFQCGVGGWGGEV